MGDPYWRIVPKEGRGPDVYVRKFPSREAAEEIQRAIGKRRTHRVVAFDRHDKRLPEAALDDMLRRHSELRETWREFDAAADWYRRCLEDVQDGRPVRGFGEAKVGYDRALDRLLTVLGDAGGNDVVS